MIVSTRRVIALIGSLAMVATLLAAPVAGSHGATGADLGSYDEYAPAIEALSLVGVLEGTECAEGDFCPDDALTREVMAVWLARALEGRDPTNEPIERFADVRADWPGAAHIEYLAELGVVEQCNGDPPVFCPFVPVTRAEAASLVAKAFDLPEASTSAFGDIADSEHAADINALADAGIAIGCSTDPPLYCPSEDMTRGQMAILLARALRLVPRPGHETEALPVDPATRVGALDNGFTYYLRSNDKPGDSITMRLAVNAGSVNEPEPGLGIAHFLEHMLFKGTAAYPGEELNSTIRNLGAELGPDTNAYVWYDETVYELTVAADQPENVSTALHVLSQLAHAATLDPDDAELERGVVLDELRLRTTTGSGQVSAEFDRIYTEGTPYEGYYAGGTIAGIEATTAEDLRDFYEKWYVPSNMAIIAVGDVPLDDLYALVEEHFGPIPPGGPRDFALPEVVPDPEPSYHVATHEDLGYEYVSLDIPIPRSYPGTGAGDRLALMEWLIEIMVLNRLDDAYYRGELQQFDPPNFSSFTYGSALRYYGTNWFSEDLAAASTAYMSALLTIEEFGFSEADLARAREQMATALDHQLETAASTNDPGYADSYVSHFLYGGDISAAQDRHDRITALVEEVTVRELTTRYRWLMNRAGPIFIVVGSDPADLPTTSDLEAAVSAAAPLSEPPQVEPSIDELMQVPDPEAPVESEELDAVDAVEWKFANGATVVFTQSDIAESTVNIRARSLGGWSQLEPGARALAPRAVEAVLASGFGGLSRPQINRFLDGSTASVAAFIGERTEGFDAAANTEDLETAFQIMHLLVTAPTVDELAYRDAVNEAAIRASLAEVNPAWQSWVAYNEARFGLEWHLPVATREQLDSMSAESLLDLYQRRLGDVDDLVVAVVGDVEADVVERLARHYIGTLPAGEPDTYVNRHRPFPEGVTRRDIPVDAEMGAVLEIHYEVNRPVTPSLRAEAHVLRVILDDILFRLIREEVGASYVTSVSVNPSFSPTHVVYSDILITSDGASLEGLHSRVLSILDDLVANGPSAEELQEAKAIAASDYDKVDNSRLLGILTSRLYIDDEELFTAARSVEELEKVTAATVQALAAELYDTENRIEIVRVPEGSSYGGE